MKDKRHPTTTPEHDTVLAHINDPAPATVESPEESKNQERRERPDDRSVLSHINDEAKADCTSDTTN